MYICIEIFDLLVQTLHAVTQTVEACVCGFPRSFVWFCTWFTWQLVLPRGKTTRILVQYCITLNLFSLFRARRRTEIGSRTRKKGKHSHCQRRTKDRHTYTDTHIHTPTHTHTYRKLPVIAGTQANTPIFADCFDKEIAWRRLKKLSISNRWYSVVGMRRLNFTCVSRMRRWRSKNGLC